MKLFGLVFALILTATAALAQDWESLETAGAIGVMRHALAPGTGDPPEFTLGDCSTQRNLDDRGRAQARRIGEAIRERNIAIDAVWSSRWCRSAETADLLGLGEVRAFAPLDSFFNSREAGPERTTALRTALADRAGDGRLILVTHQVNITALTGIFPRSGEIVVIDVSDDGAVTVTGRILVDP